MKTRLTYLDSEPGERINVRLKRPDIYAVRQAANQAGIDTAQFIREGIAMRIAAGRFTLTKEEVEAIGKQEKQAA